MTEKPSGTVHAAGRESRISYQASPVSVNIVTRPAVSAGTPPASMPAMAPTVVMRLDQIPSISKGHNEDAATANARPTMSATGIPVDTNVIASGTRPASTVEI